MYLTSTENYKYVIYFQFLSSESTLKGTQSIDMFLRDTMSLCTCTTWVDASYACHHDMRSHTGGTIFMGKGVLYTRSTKQNFDTKSSTKAELVGASDFLSQTM